MCSFCGVTQKLLPPTTNGTCHIFWVHPIRKFYCIKAKQYTQYVYNVFHTCGVCFVWSQNVAIEIGVQ